MSIIHNSYSSTPHSNHVMSGYTTGLTSIQQHPAKLLHVGPCLHIATVLTPQHGYHGAHMDNIATSRHDKPTCAMLSGLNTHFRIAHILVETNSWWCGTARTGRSQCRQSGKAPRHYAPCIMSHALRAMHYEPCITCHAL